MAKARILIVDDDGDLVAAIKIVLEGSGYEVITAFDREEGMGKLKEQKPDLMILDVMMTAWQDGFEMAREVKKDDQFKDTPILMLSGVGDKTGMDFKSESGDEEWLPVDVFLDKPVKSDVLLAEVEKLLS
ncbi:MAG: response regulator [Sedimentisphaerales bacterium]|nr:response regulator [Sedimentisphaerales bacterium]